MSVSAYLGTVVPAFNGPSDERTPAMAGHFLNDIEKVSLTMYGLFYHVNVPLMRGHLVNAETRRGYFGFLSLLRRTVISIFVFFFSKYFISKMATDKQHGV